MSKATVGLFWYNRGLCVAETIVMLIVVFCKYAPHMHAPVAILLVCGHLTDMTKCVRICVRVSEDRWYKVA